MPTTVVEKFGSESATGVAREVTFGSPLTPTSFIPMTGNELQLDIGLFSPHVMFGQKDLNTFPLYGQYKMSGSVTAPAWPTNGTLFLSAAIGPDAQVGYGVAALPTTQSATTLSASASAGATSVTITSATGFATGQQIAIDTNSSAGTFQEIRKISNVAGTTITLADALTYAHASGVAAVTGTTTTLSALSTAGATTVTVTSATGISIGTIIQIDVNSPAGSFTSEIRKVTSIASLTLTLDVALTYAHANAALVVIVSAPYTHAIQQANTLNSLTVEKDLGSFESLQFAGCRVNKLGFSIAATNTEATITADLIAKSVAVLASPTAITITNESPWVFAETSVTLFNQIVAQAISAELSIENGVKETYTFNNSHNPQFLTPVTRAITVKIDVVYQSFDDATWGYFNQMVAGTSGSLQLFFAHPTTGGSLLINLPKVVLGKTPDSVKMEDIITTSLELTAFLNIPTLQTINIVVVGQNYLPA